MKKIFETNDKHEINSLKNYLNDQYYESEIKNTSVKYELFVHENIYDDVLVEIQQMNKKLSGTIVLDKNKNISENNYKKGSFVYFVEKYFQLKYIHLCIFSVVYSLAIHVTAIIFLRSGIITTGKNIQLEYLPISMMLFCITIFFSQLVLICTRYYQTLEMLTEIFVIRIGKKNDYSSLHYKIINVIIAVIGHLIMIVFMITMYKEIIIHALY